MNWKLVTGFLLTALMGAVVVHMTSEGERDGSAHPSAVEAAAPASELARWRDDGKLVRIWIDAESGCGYLVTWNGAWSSAAAITPRMRADGKQWCSGGIGGLR